MGGEKHELDKRLAAELSEAQPALFLDNANGVALRSDTLASVLTERPARVRVLGQTRMVVLEQHRFRCRYRQGLERYQRISPAGSFIASSMPAAKMP